MTQLLSQAEEIKILLKSIDKNFRNVVLEKIKEHGYTFPQLLLMQEIYQNPEITMVELSEKMGLAKSTVSGIVDRLEKQGAVIRVRNGQDRRSVNLILTPEVLALRDTVNLLKNNYLANLLKELESPEVEEILRSLRTLNQLMESSIKKQA